MIASNTVDLLLAIARQSGDVPNGIITVEKFMYALLDVIDSGIEIEELRILKDTLISLNVKIGESKDRLLKYINFRGANGLEEDEKKMKQLISLAGNGTGVLTAEKLLMTILEENDPNIMQILGLTGDTKERISPDDIFFPELDIEIDKDEDEDEDGIAESKAKLDRIISHIKSVRRKLQADVVGQDHAINTFIEGYFQALLNAESGENKNKPKASFLFAGPPGVGKTMLAETVAKSLGVEYQVFDMSSFSHDESVTDFQGLNKSYKESSPGLVTGFVRNNPKCVVVFDEIEKAHSTIIHLFLQLLDRAKVKDFHYNEDVSFKDAIVILTTNAGKQLYEDEKCKDFSNIPGKVIVQALGKDKNPETNAPLFPNSILSRMAASNVVMFNHMEAHDLLGIVKKQFERKSQKFKASMGIDVRFDENIYASFLFASGGSADARTVSGKSKAFFDQEIFELMRLISSEKTATQISDVEKIKFRVDLSKSPKDIVKLFKNSKKPSILLFAEEDFVERCNSEIDSATFFGAQNVDEAIELIKKNKISAVIVDFLCGVEDNVGEILNIEDIESEGRRFFKYMCENRSTVPSYVLQGEKYSLTEEERNSLMRQGARGILLNRHSDYLAQRVEAIGMAAYYQESIRNLARESKVISFETAQTVSQNGKNAEIILFDFKKTVAIDSDDKDDILGALSLPDVKFKQIIGAKEAKKELQYVVDYLKNPGENARIGARTPRGLIFYGPPGTGKTMLAKAVAAEAGVPFIATQGNEFLKANLGAGAARVHELFRKARKYAPSILFIDEVDAIGAERKISGGYSSVPEDVLTAFLAEMDGFSTDTTRPVYVLAATNYGVDSRMGKSLDAAFVRRFDRNLKIDLPNKKERAEFIKLKVADNPALQITPKKIEDIALRAVGMSPADLDSVIELSLRSAIMAKQQTVTDESFDEAFEDYRNGTAKAWDISQFERVARHEAGHALISCLSGDFPTYLTVVARGDHGGYMQHAENEGKGLYTKDELLARIRTSLGGRAAEIVCYGENDGTSTGAYGDLMNATHIARGIICSYGMDEDFGLAVVQEDGNAPMTPEVRTVVNALLKEQMNEAVRLIRENRSKLDALVKKLMKKDHLSGEEIKKILGF